MKKNITSLIYLLALIFLLGYQIDAHAQLYTAKFSVDTATICSGDTLIFYNQTDASRYQGTGKAISYQWTLNKYDKQNNTAVLIESVNYPSLKEYGKRFWNTTDHDIWYGVTLDLKVNGVDQQNEIPYEKLVLVHNAPVIQFNNLLDPVVACENAPITLKLNTYYLNNCVKIWSTPGMNYDSVQIQCPPYPGYPDNYLRVGIIDTLNGCTSSKSVRIMKMKEFALTFVPTNDIYVAKGDTAQVTLSGEEKYVWATKTGLYLGKNHDQVVDTVMISTMPLTNSLVYFPVTTYKFIGIAGPKREGCILHDSIHIHVKPPVKTIPGAYNLITPGSTKNNHWTIDNDPNVYADSNSALTIYNGWGQQVYSLNIPRDWAGWDGKTDGGEACPEGTYYYVLKSIWVTYTGYITLLR